MGRQLVLVHGRSQGGKDAAGLKAQWLASLGEGLAKNGLSLPVGEADVRFPYYGDTLDQLTGGIPADAAADVIIRGDDSGDEEKEFTLAVVEEIRRQAGISTGQVAEAAGQEAVERGPQHWGWVQAVLQAIDAHVPHASGASIALITRDVYRYLTDPVIRRELDDGVASALTAGTGTVVVGHSLGTVVAYNVLRQAGTGKGWTVPQFVTVGSPLAVTAIRKALKRFGHTRCPECVSAWYNAFDERDVVALYPLDTSRFPLDPATPAIDNNTAVVNDTGNHHGISGYLADKDVAKVIHDALAA